jgi:citrate lyase subunit beta / citryl-CoA lyase
MSAERGRAPRSILAVPASSRRMVEKAAASAAEEVFLDLEDACAEDAKNDAREMAVAELLELDWSGKRRAVRVNGARSRWSAEDVVTVMRGVGGAAGLDALVIPKAESAAEIHFFDLLLDQLEAELPAPGRVKLEVLIESPRAAIDAGRILGASDRIGAVIFGAGDYAAALGIPQFDIGAIEAGYPGHQWNWVMSAIGAHAAALGIEAVDGPFGKFTDEAGYREACSRARFLGFGGKWCIHPAQIEWANSAFEFTAAERERAERVLAAYREGAADGVGAVALDGSLIDQASERLAENVMRRAGVPDGPLEA